MVISRKRPTSLLVERERIEVPRCPVCDSRMKIEPGLCNYYPNCHLVYHKNKSEENKR